ncbi:zinc finger MYM-type 1-like [Brachionus plicatilis]|uniref:Zinc finger MYM-type 1-like n=1 Tax=Brachionus plicatilis TaxID=10195 RepID=A0A3M7S4J5_BRAPC|nr:zinc finger MYM-type 1-like [Brachionus plicatilis]
MSGRYKGVASRLKADNKKAIYVHCYAHKLNLAIQKTCSTITEICNCIGSVNTICNLIEASPKRHEIFKNIQQEYMQKTRWASRNKALKSIKDNLPIIFETLIEIDKNDSSLSGCQAGLLLNSIKTFDFVFYITVLSDLFEQINFLSLY